MTYARIAFPLAAAAYMLAAALPATAQDVQGSGYNGAQSVYGAAVRKYKRAPAAAAAYAEVPTSSCHLETWETADHYIRQITMCGPW
jgi:hypothetical protein